MDGRRCAGQQVTEIRPVKLLEHQADINRQDEDGRTALSWAVSKGNGAVVKQLMEYRADIDITTNEKKTAPQLATERGYIGIVRPLSQYT